MMLNSSLRQAVVRTQMICVRFLRQYTATHRQKSLILWLLPLATLIVFFWAWNLRWPYIGNDMAVWIPYFITGKWHFANQGLLPFLFSPHLCGGVPVYANTHDFYYSPLGLISVFTTPWFAVQVTTALCILGGYFGWYLFGKRVTRLSSMWSHVLAVVIILNGFYLMHISVTHLWAISFFLIGWIAYLLFDNQQVSVKTFFVRMAGFALLISGIIHGAGFLTLFFAVFAGMLALPPYLLLSSGGYRAYGRMLVRFVAFGVAGLCAAASKLVFIQSFLAFFPRDADYPVYSGDIVWRVLHSMFWPFIDFSHENSVYVSPIVIVGLLCTLLLPFIAPSQGNASRSMRLKAVLVLGYAVFICFFFLQLIAGKGALVDTVLNAPVFSSMREPLRYLLVFELLLSVCSVWLLARAAERCGNRMNTAFAALSIAVTMCFFFVVSYPLIHSLGINNNNRSLNEWWWDLDKNQHTTLSVEEISRDTDYRTKAGIYCSDPLLGWAKDPQSEHLQEGSVLLEEDGYLNLMNPVCYLAPTENNCEPTERFKVEEKAVFDAFRTGEPVRWKFTPIQRISGFLSLLTVMVSVVFLAGAGIDAYRKRSRITTI